MTGCVKKHAVLPWEETQLEHLTPDTAAAGTVDWLTAELWVQTNVGHSVTLLNYQTVLIGLQSNIRMHREWSVCSFTVWLSMFLTEWTGRLREHSERGKPLLVASNDVRLSPGMILADIHMHWELTFSFQAYLSVPLTPDNHICTDVTCAFRWQGHCFISFSFTFAFRAISSSFSRRALVELDLRFGLWYTHSQALTAKYYQSDHLFLFSQPGIRVWAHSGFSDTSTLYYYLQYNAFFDIIQDSLQLSICSCVILAGGTKRCLYKLWSAFSSPSSQKVSAISLPSSLSAYSQSCANLNSAFQPSISFCNLVRLSLPCTLLFHSGACSVSHLYFSSVHPPSVNLFIQHSGTLYCQADRWE